MRPADRVHSGGPDVFGISDIHESGVRLSDKSISGPLRGPGVEMVASLGSATDLDAVASLCAIVLDDSQEMKVALCGISAVWRGQEERKNQTRLGALALIQRSPTS